MSSANGQAGQDSAFEAVFAAHADEVFRFCSAIEGESNAGPLLRRVARRAATEFDGQRTSTEQRKWLLGLAHLESVAAEPAEPAVAATVPPAAARAPDAAAAPAAPPDAAAAPAAGIQEQAARFSKTAFGGLVLRELGRFRYEAIAEILDTSPDLVHQGVSEIRRALQPHLPREGQMCDVAREIMADDEPDAAAEATLGEHLDECSECPEVEASMGGIAGALDRALPHVAQPLLKAALKEATAYAAEAPPPSPAPDAGRGGRLSRYSRRSLALAGAALVLVSAGALGFGATSLDDPNEASLPSSGALSGGQGIGGVSEESLVPPCPSGTERVRDHCEPPCPDGTERVNDVCEPECPEGTRRVRDECVADCPAGTVRVRDRCVPDCPEGTRPVRGECFFDPPRIVCPPLTRPVGRRCLPIVPRVICPVGVLRNGRCEVDVVCPPRTFLRRGQCERLPVCPPRTMLVRNGDCVLRARCPKGTKRISRNRCLGPVVCPEGTTRDGLVCRAPVVCPGNSTPVGDRCIRPAECPKGTTPVGDRCVLPCPGTLWRLTHPCLDPHEPEEWVDRHGDSHGRGHRPGGGRGHDPSHNARAAPAEPAPDPTTAVPPEYPTSGAPSGYPAAPEPEWGPEPDGHVSPPPPPPGDPAPARPAAPPPAPAQGPATHPGRGHGREHAPGQQGGAGRGRGHGGQIPPVAMLLISAMMAPAVSRAGSRARPSRRTGPGRGGGPTGRRRRRGRPGSRPR